jgi:hypothetical protein
VLHSSPLKLNFVPEIRPKVEDMENPRKSIKNKKIESKQLKSSTMRHPRWLAYQTVPIWLVASTPYLHPSLHSTQWPCTRLCATLGWLASTIPYATLGWLVLIACADMTVPRTPYRHPCHCGRCPVLHKPHAGPKMVRALHTISSPVLM